MKGKPLKERVGEVYGYIKIIDYGYREYDKGSKRKRGTLIFECECGNIKEVLAHNIIQGNVKSCGCKEKYLKAKASTKHAFHKERIYQTYHDMKNRCLNKNNSSFHRYGGRGIKICDEWLLDFMNFYNWAMNNGYEEHLTIERINNDGNYEPRNCKWSSVKEQNQNTSRSYIYKRYPVLALEKSGRKWIETEYPNILSASEELGIKKGYILDCCKGIRETTFGIKFILLEELK